MTSKLFTLFLGMALGFTIGAAVLWHKAPGSPVAAVEASATADEQIAELKSQLASAKAKLEKAQADNDKLVARTQELLNRESASAETNGHPSKQQGGLAALFGGDGTNSMSAAMRDMMKATLEQQIDAKLAGMKAKLNLTPEQEKAIREIMEKQMSRGVETAEKMFKGDLSKDEVSSLSSQPMNEEQQIKALLTPEQLAAYDDYDKEEKTRMARLVANSELIQMQSTLQLTVEQQDKVFAVLADQAQFQFDPKAMGTNAFDFRHLADLKAEALHGVLTPEQFERYQKFQEQQLKMIEAFMPKDAAHGDPQAATGSTP